VKGSTARDYKPKVSTLPAASSLYDKLEHGHMNDDAAGYNVLSHHTVEGKKSLISLPYDQLDHLESNRNSVASLHLSPHVSPRTSPPGSRKSSYSLLHGVRDKITEEGNEPEEIYELPLDPSDTGDYGKLDHTSHRPPKLPPKNVSTPQSEYGRLNHGTSYEPSTEQNQYGKLDHTNCPPELPQRRAVENDYGRPNHPKQHEVMTEPDSEYSKLNHHTNHPPKLPQRRTIVQENEYGRLDHSKQQKTTLDPLGEYIKLGQTTQPPALPPKRTTIQENEYSKLDHSKQYKMTSEPQSEYGKLDHTNRAPKLPQRNSLQEDEYETCCHNALETSSTSESNEYSHLDLTGQQDTSIIQQSNHQNQAEVAQQSEYGKLNHKPQISHRKSLQQEHSGKTKSSETDSIPPGYETFKRVHGASISSSVSSCNSELDDQLDRSNKLFSVSNDDNDAEYSQLDPIADNVDPTLTRFLTNDQTPVTANAQPNTSHASEKPKPKPRNI